MLQNILTVDLEDWFVVENLRNHINPSDWDDIPLRAEKNTMRLLHMFQEYRIRTTFFVLGWMAQKLPTLIREIACAGHEIACHGYEHRRIDQMDEGLFRDDTKKAIDIILKSSGHIPLGYRAPSWSINSSIPWAWEVLADLGFKYDSSVFPIRHDIYGEPNAPREFFKLNLKSGRILYELPASTMRILGHNIPFGGGGYFRLTPYWLTSRMIWRENRIGRQVMVYIHPWEIDKDQPRINNLTMLQRLRQYGSLSTMEKKLENLLREFDFISASDYVTQMTKKRIGFEGE
jgi:polysaccharide deacetylase family protein (PEP-CTERM system associated)